jgi:hypothetical protein
MAEGSIYKRCSCRDERGGNLGIRCPRLSRPGGAWSPTHGLDQPDLLRVRRLIYAG